METERLMQREIAINWYRCPIDRAEMSRLMKRSDLRATTHACLHLGLFALTGTVSYLAFQNISPANWIWSVPVLLFCLFVHGTFAGFHGGVAVHELTHKTAFRSPALNDFFVQVFSFISWFDPVAFRLSHVKHHQVTVHHDRDGEVILPQTLNWAALKEGDTTLPETRSWDFVKFVFWQVAPLPNPALVWERWRRWWRYAFGSLDGVAMFAGGEWWTRQLFPADKPESRQRHRNWARVLLCGHLALAAIFVLTGHWFLIVVFTCAGTYAGWLASLCGLPQHIGMGPDVPDFRLCCRTYTCNRFLGFLYWNMQYHVEHHMFPGVPFYHLPALRRAIEHDLPPAPHGLVATWREIVAVLKRQRLEPGYHFVPKLPEPAPATSRKAAALPSSSAIAS